MGVMRNDFTERMKDDLYTWYWESYPQKPAVWESIFEVVQSSSA